MNYLTPIREKVKHNHKIEIQSVLADLDNVKNRLG